MGGSGGSARLDRFAITSGVTSEPRIVAASSEFSTSRDVSCSRKKCPQTQAIRVVSALRPGGHFGQYQDRGEAQLSVQRFAHIAQILAIGILIAILPIAK